MDPTQIQQAIEGLQARVKKLETDTPLTFHTHTGFDMNKVDFSNLTGRQVFIAHTIYGADPATSANYSTFFIAPVACAVSTFYEAHTTAGSDGSAVTLQLEKLTSTTAPGSGTTLLSSALSLKATANTVQIGSLTTTLASLSLAVGNRLALKLSGTPTSVANVSVLVGLTF